MGKFYERVFFPTLDQYGIQTVLHGGDFFDRRKYVNYATAQFVWDAYRTPLHNRSITEFILAGNHDLFYKESVKVNAIREMYRDASWVHIVDHPTELHLDGIDWLFLPWICDENCERSYDLLRTSRASHVLGHLPITGFAMYKGQPAEEGFDPELFNRFEAVYSGHFHHQSQAGPIKYLGAPYPMVWSDFNDARGFHIFDTDTKALTFIDNPYSLFKRIVYHDAGKKYDYLEGLVGQISAPDSTFHDAYVKIIVQSKTQPYWFDLLMDSLYRVNAVDITVLDDIIVNDDDSETLSPKEITNLDTLSVIEEYVDSLNMSTDTTALKTYLRTLYHRATDAAALAA